MHISEEFGLKTYTHTEDMIGKQIGDLTKDRTETFTKEHIELIYVCKEQILLRNK